MNGSPPRGNVGPFFFHQHRIRTVPVHTHAQHARKTYQIALETAPNAHYICLNKCREKRNAGEKLQHKGKFVAYYRLSTAKQEVFASGLGLEAQRTASSITWMVAVGSLSLRSPKNPARRTVGRL